MRYLSLLLLLTALAGLSAGGEAAADTASFHFAQGRSWFQACEFKKAARAFERALVGQPEIADRHYWLGKSYARWAEIAGPFSAPGYARKARAHLEKAVQLAPRNAEYRRELFEFYVDSPEWFSGGLKRAAALGERLDGGDSGREEWLDELRESRAEHSGPAWWFRRAILWSSGAMGRVVP
jgi:tetratricopeptide (TPR) repeat protein